MAGGRRVELAKWRVLRVFDWGWAIGYGKVMVDVAVRLSGDGYGEVAKAWWGC